MRHICPEITKNESLEQLQAEHELGSKGVRVRSDDLMLTLFGQLRSQPPLQRSRENTRASKITLPPFTLSAGVRGLGCAPDGIEGLRRMTFSYLAVKVTRTPKVAILMSKECTEIVARDSWLADFSSFNPNLSILYGAVSPHRQ